METELETEGKVLKEWKGETMPKTVNKKSKKKDSLLRKKLANKKIVSKGRRTTLVLNIANKQRGDIKNMMKETIQEDRRNFFFK